MRQSKPVLDTHIGTILLVWNFVAFVVLAVIWVYALCVTSIGDPGRVTELDRAGVLDEAMFREKFPDIGGIRHDLGMWIAEGERKTALLAAKTGTVIVAANLVLILIGRFVRRRPPIEGTRLSETTTG